MHGVNNHRKSPALNCAQEHYENLAGISVPIFKGFF